MMSNARILRIDRRTGSAADGTSIMTTGTATSIECFLDGISSSQKWKLESKIQDANWVCYVEDDALAMSGEAEPKVGDVVAAVLDNADDTPGDPADAMTGQVLLAKVERLGMLSHVELYLKVV